MAAPSAAPCRRDYYVAVSTPEARLPTLVELIQALVAPPGARPNGVAPLAAVVVASSRDSLDKCALALRQCGSEGTGSRDLSVVVLHGDLSDRELEQHAAEFRAKLSAGRQRAAGERARRSVAAGAAGEEEAAAATAVPPSASSAATAAAVTAAAALRPRSALMLLATDACLRGLLRLGSAGALLLPQASADGAHTTPAADADAPLSSAPPPLLVQFDLPTTREAFVARLSVAFGARAAARKASAAAGGGAGGSGAAAAAAVPPPPATPIAPAPTPSPVVIDFFSASEVPLFRARERFLPGAGPVEEMPVSVTDVFK